jgi:hypothetical protein
VVEEEELPEPIKPFSFLTPVELAYFELGEPHVGGDSGSGNNDVYDEEDDEMTE